MSLSFREGHRVYVYQEAIDMRAGFNKLTMYIREKMKRDVLQGDLFLFLGKNRKRLKALYYDGTGLVQIAKRMEHGKFMSIVDLEYKEITVDEVQLILHGSIVRRTKFGEEALTKAKGMNNIIGHEGAGARNGYRNPSSNGALASQGKPGTQAPASSRH